LTIPFIKTNNFIIIYVLAGLILELSAKICQMFLYQKPKITLDKWFVVWVLIHSIVSYGVIYLVRKINLSNQYLFILSVGFGIAIITHIIWRFMYSEKKNVSPCSKTNIFNKIKFRYKLLIGLIILNLIIYMTINQFFLFIILLDSLFIIIWMFGWSGSCPKCHNF